jgi:transposase
MLTNDQWSVLKPLFPPPSPYLRGRPPLDDRLILDAIIYKVYHAIAWYDLPPGFPSHQTVYRRYRQWQRIGLWYRIVRTLLCDLTDRGAFDMSQALSTRLYRTHLNWNKIILSLDPSAPDTWQVATGYFILCELARWDAPGLKKIHPLPTIPRTFVFSRLLEWARTAALPLDPDDRNPA